MNRKALIFIIVAALIAITAVFTNLSIINNKDLPEDYFSSVPSILPILNAEWFMGLVFVSTVAGLTGAIYLLWRVHEIPVHRAKREDQLLGKVIFGLALCGLFLHKVWWVVAIILAFTPWEEIGKQLSRVFGNVGGAVQETGVDTDPEREEEQP